LTHARCEASTRACRRGRSGRDAAAVSRHDGEPLCTITAAATAGGFGGCACTCSLPPGTPRAAILASADQKERDVALRLFPIGLHGGEVVICDKGYAGKEFARLAAERHGALVLRPTRQTDPSRGPHPAPIRQCIESIFWRLKDRLGLERHNASTPHGLRARMTTKLLALAASVWLNHYLGRPTRGLAALAV
jgi:hypothetical protein